MILSKLKKHKFKKKKRAISLPYHITDYIMFYNGIFFLLVIISPVGYAVIVFILFGGFFSIAVIVMFVFCLTSLKC